MGLYLTIAYYPLLTTQGLLPKAYYPRLITQGLLPIAYHLCSLLVPHYLHVNQTYLVNF